MEFRLLYQQSSQRDRHRGTNLSRIDPPDLSANDLAPQETQRSRGLRGGGWARGGHRRGFGGTSAPGHNRVDVVAWLPDAHRVAKRPRDPAAPRDGGEVRLRV